MYCTPIFLAMTFVVETGVGEAAAILAWLDVFSHAHVLFVQYVCHLSAFIELSRIVPLLVRVVGRFFHWSKICVDYDGVHMYRVGFGKRLAVASSAPLCLVFRFQPLH